MNKMDKYIDYIKEKSKNRRIVTVVLLIVAFLSLFGPFAKLNFSASLSTPVTTNKVIYNSKTIGSVSLRSFANFSNVGDITINNRPIKSYEVFGVNIYSTLKTPPNLTKQANNAVDALNPEFLASLSQKPLEQQLIKLSPQYGRDMFNIASATGKKLLGVRDLLVAAKPAIEDTDATLKQVASSLKAAENYKTIANIFIFILFALTALSFVLFAIAKVPAIVPRVLAIICLITIVAMSFAIPIINTQINSSIEQITTKVNADINAQVNSILKSMLGDKASLFSLIGGANADYVGLNVGLSLGWGPILAIISLIAAIVTSLFIPKNNRLVNEVKEESNPENIVEQDNTDLAKSDEVSEEEITEDSTENTDLDSETLKPEADKDNAEDSTENTDIENNKSDVDNAEDSKETTVSENSESVVNDVEDSKKKLNKSKKNRKTKNSK